MRIILNEKQPTFYDALTLLTLFILGTHLCAIRNECELKKGKYKK